MPTPLELLTNINLDDLVNAFGLANAPSLASAVRAVFHTPAEKFARQMLEFDQAVGAGSLANGAARILPYYADTVQVIGQENLPPTGPLIVLSNHPGMADTLALFHAIQRADLRIIAVNRPFLLALPNTSKHLFYISDDPTERMRAVRQSAGHLKNGGAILTFPAGKIEPDPDVYPGAEEALGGWTDSAAVLARFAPQTQIVPALVRGVLWEKAVKHPLTYIKREREERERLGAALQLLGYTMFNLHPVRINVHFGQPIRMETPDPAVLHQAVIESMHQMLHSLR
jgi:hypothetical protein